MEVFSAVDAEDGVGRGRQLLHALHQPDDEAVLLVGVQARHAAHVHLEGVHALAGIQGQLVDLLLLPQGEVGDHVHPGQLEHLPAQAVDHRQIAAGLIEVGADGGDAPQDGGAGLALQLLAEGHRQAQVGVGVDDPRQHIQAGGVDDPAAPGHLRRQGGDLPGPGRTHSAAGSPSPAARRCRPG